MYHEVLRDVCTKYGKIYSKELQSRLIGGTDRAICEYVVKELQINESVDKFEKRVLEVSAQKLPHAPLQKGVERLIKHLLLHQVPMALATNSTAQHVELHAKTKPEIFSAFHHAVTATDKDVRRGKPFPDVYLLAAEKFNEKPKPAKCLVFEDSVVGLRAGLAAGMQVVVTPHNTHLKPEDAKEATLVLDSLMDFKPELFGLPPFGDTNTRAPICCGNLCAVMCPKHFCSDVLTNLDQIWDRTPEISFQANDRINKTIARCQPKQNVYTGPCWVGPGWCRPCYPCCPPCKPKPPPPPPPLWPKLLALALLLGLLYLLYASWAAAQEEELKKEREKKKDPPWPKLIALTLLLIGLIALTFMQLRIR